MLKTNLKNNFIIAIDGVSGSGKSSTAKRVAKELGILHLDTGAMYRAVTFLSLEQKIPVVDVVGVSTLTQGMEIDFNPAGDILVSQRNLAREIRTPEVNAHVSDYCAIPKVREILVDKQRNIGNLKSTVLEGRDIGTVVFPKADFKFFMSARPEIRAKRRKAELDAAGIPANEAEILKNLVERDQKDSSRETAPLKKAEDAIEIDTSDLTFDQQVATIVRHVRDRLPAL